MSDNRFSVIGLLAHVDAGKTTVCERLLYDGGAIDSFGRVDKKESLLDYLPVERARGITVFPKQAVIEGTGHTLTLIDTPGHEDFYAEALRSLRALDLAILVSDASRNITDYTKRLYFALLEADVPVIIFFNKMDICHRERIEILDEAREVFEADIIDMGTEAQQLYDAVALTDEASLEEFLERGEISPGRIGGLIRRRTFIPAFFGSALKGDGCKALLEAVFTYAPVREPKDSVSGVVYHISYDKGMRLFHTRLTGGRIELKGALLDKKVEEIRLYSGASFSVLKAAKAGMCVAVRGVDSLQLNLGFGEEDSRDEVYKRLEPKGEPYVLYLPSGSDIKKSYDRLSLLFEQFPECRLFLDVTTNSIYLSIMGPVMEQVLLYMIKEELGLNVSFERYSGADYIIEEEIFFEEEEEPEYEEDNRPRGGVASDPYAMGLEEIEAIIMRAGGSNKKSSSDMRRSHWNRYRREESADMPTGSKPTPKPAKIGAEEYLLVDGYNCIFAWEELTSLSADNIDSAKDALVDILSEYSHMSGARVILVFDAYKVAGGVGSTSRQKGIHVVHTKEAQTADAYIELTNRELSTSYNVTVATSDRLEQIIVRGDGARVLSASDLLYEIARLKNEVRAELSKKESGTLKVSIGDNWGQAPTDQGTGTF